MGIEMGEDRFIVVLKKNDITSEAVEVTEYKRPEDAEIAIGQYLKMSISPKNIRVFKGWECALRFKEVTIYASRF